MADRLKAPTASLRDGAQDYSSKVNRGQSVANQTGGRNYSGEYSSSFSAVSNLMKQLGTGAQMASAIGKGIATDNYTKQQKSTLSKYNQSAQKLGMARQEVQNIKNEMGTIKGTIDALNKTACDYADQLKKLQGDLDAKEKDLKQSEADKKSAQDKFNRAQQDFKNAMTPSRTTPPSQRRKDADTANKNMRDAQYEEMSADERATQAQNEANQIGGQKNSTLDQSNANLADMADRYGDYSEAQRLAGEALANEKMELQNMGNAMRDYKNDSANYLEQMKTWGAVDTGGRQMTGWSDSVDAFGKAKYYEGGASALNQTINTLRGLENFGQTGDMVAPFLTESITQLGKILENGGTMGDFGMAMGQSVMGLNSWMQAEQAFENAFNYAEAGDSFMSAVEGNRAIPNLFDGAERIAQTTNFFMGSPVPAQAVDQLFNAGSTFTQTLHGKMISNFEMAKVGADMDAQFGMGSTALPYACAKTFAETMDGIGREFGQDFGLSQELSNIRNEFASDMYGQDMMQFTDKINIPPSTLRSDLVTQYTPNLDFDAPDETDQMKDPFNQSSRGGGTGSNQKSCPPIKPPVSSIIASDPLL